MIQYIVFQLSSCFLSGDFPSFELFFKCIENISFEKLGSWLALSNEALYGQIAIHFYLLYCLGGSLKDLINGIKNIMTV